MNDFHLTKLAQGRTQRLTAEAAASRLASHAGQRSAGRMPALPRRALRSSLELIFGRQPAHQR